MLEPRAVRCGGARAGAAAKPWNGRDSESECGVRCVVTRGRAVRGAARKTSRFRWLRVDGPERTWSKGNGRAGKDVEGAGNQ
jgi:hypothetical protein